MITPAQAHLESFQVSVSQSNLSDLRKLVTENIQSDYRLITHEQMISSVLYGFTLVHYLEPEKKQPKIYFALSALEFIATQSGSDHQHIDWSRITKNLNVDIVHNNGNPEAYMLAIKSLLQFHPTLTIDKLQNEALVTPLMAATSSIFDYRPLMLDMIHMGFDVNHRSKENGRPIHFINPFDDYKKEKLVMLLDHGADPLEHAHYTYTALKRTNNPYAGEYYSFMDFAKQNELTDLTEICDRYNNARIAMNVTGQPETVVQRKPSTSI